MKRKGKKKKKKKSQHQQGTGEQDVLLAEGHDRSDVVDLIMAKAPAASPFRDAKVERSFRELVRDSFFELVDVSTRLMLVLEGKTVEGTLYISPAVVFANAKLVVSVHVLEFVEVEVVGPALRLLLRDEMLLEFLPVQGADCVHEARLIRGLWQSERAGQKSPVTTLSGPAGYFTKEILSDPQEFSPSYPDWSRERLDLWKE